MKRFTKTNLTALCRKNAGGFLLALLSAFSMVFSPLVMAGDPAEVQNATPPPNLECQTYVDNITSACSTPGDPAALARDSKMAA
ncbi:MAG: hypothetical protein KDD22_08250, partial [Bdellovibrionales bacterium]|nr:hypothetical protein [Bdellovibrionales bacterium]